MQKHSRKQRRVVLRLKPGERIVVVTNSKGAVPLKLPPGARAYVEKVLTTPAS